MAGRNNTFFPTPPPSIVQRGPDMGNVPTADAYLRTKQNFDAIYGTLDNIVKIIAPTSVSKAQLDVIQKALQAQGSNPLNLTGLVPLSNLGAVQLIGTHAKRKTIQPSTFAVGTLWYETDHTVLYTVLQISGGSRWQYETGIYSAAFASRPADLGTYDSGFLFYATDLAVTYRWTGAAWFIKGELGVTLGDTHANRNANFAANAYPTGTTFFETDRTVVYRDNGANNWAYMDGTMRGNIADRPATLGAADVGFQFWALDTQKGSYWNGNNWIGLGQLLAGNNITLTPDAANGTITIAAAGGVAGGAWSNNGWTLTVTPSNGVATTGAAEFSYIQSGKTVTFRITWAGNLNAASRDIAFAAPVAPKVLTDFQMAPVGYMNTVAPNPIVAAAMAFIDDGGNSIIARTTANWPAGSNLQLYIQGTYEAN